MNSTKKNFWIVVVVAAVVVAAVIALVQSPDETAARNEQEPPASGNQDSDGLPAGHPPVSRGNGTGAPSASGAVASVDPDAHFTHFRVGQRNVKTLLPDGDIVWVGTSARLRR